METSSDIAAIIKQVLEEHSHYWQDRLPEMKRLRAAYMTTFFEGLDIIPGNIRVETADGYAFVESFMAALFEKAPSVEVDSIIASPESTDIAKSIVNDWLNGSRKALENGSRLALIYPMSFFKVTPKTSANVLKSVNARALEPWVVIVDREADLWEEQRYCGHYYYLPLGEARKLYPKATLQPISKPNYFDSTEIRDGFLPDDLRFIQVVEFYDLVRDKLHFYSPQAVDNDGILFSSSIPLRNPDGTALLPISPLYYSRTPDRPLEGYSTLGRIYDQLAEKNILRSHWANAIRRDSRQYLYKKDAIDAESLAKLTAGVDGLMIAIEGENLEGVIKAVPVEPLSANFDRYLQAIEQDISRGSVLAPFARGEATRATATEVTALAQYTASEIGRMARERDEAIELLSHIYLRALVTNLDEDKKPIIMVNKKARAITSSMIDHDFRFYALDQGATPLSNADKQNRLLNLLETLTALGVPMPVLKEELIRVFGLPDSFLQEPVPEPAVDTPPPVGADVPVEEVDAAAAIGMPEGEV